MAELIDAHHHLWTYDAEQYAWITPAMHVLQRDFLPTDLLQEMAPIGIDGAVAVQARQTVEETRWLLECAAHTSAIRGVVGWLPLTQPDFPKLLAPLLEERLLKGLRHVVQDEPDDRFLLGKDFNNGIAALRGTNLVYDLLIRPHHLQHAAAFAANHPDQVFVLDHLAKPEVGGDGFTSWYEGLEKLARHPQMHCKLSGLVTEADWQTWTLDDLRPFLNAALKVFGAERLLAGSDWPVCLLASTYSRWWGSLFEWAAPLTGRERDLIFGGNATRVYRLREQRADFGPHS